MLTPHRSELAGEGPIALTAATPLVPAGFTINVASSGMAMILKRATSCEAVTVNGIDPRPANLSQIGINIVPPDGTGDINNYTLVYVSNNPKLVDHFIAAGLPADYDPLSTYEYTSSSTRKGKPLCCGRFPGSAALLYLWAGDRNST